MTRFASLLLLTAAACSASDDPCGAAAEKIATCFPDQATVATCDPATAEDVAAASCEEIAMHGGKSDDPWCPWMPWLCTGSGGSGTTSGAKIEVATEECGGMLGDLCPYVTGASCGLVTLHNQSGTEVARGFTSDGGRFTFSGLPDGKYTVKIHERDGSLATMQPDELSARTEPAKISVEAKRTGDVPWTRFELVPGSQDAIMQCAVLDGTLTVKSASGAEVDRHEVEWDWIVELEKDGEILERTRPLYIHPGQNVINIGSALTGEYTLRFVRMDIPSYAQRPNPDYAQLLRLYTEDSVEPLEYALKITNAQRNQTISISRTITDPLAE